MYPIKETIAEPKDRIPWCETQMKERLKAKVVEAEARHADARDEHPKETVEEIQTEDT